MINEILNYDTEFQKKIDNDVWKFELLRPKAKMRRASLINEYLGGVPVDNVANDVYDMAYIIATLQLAYRAGPGWFVEKFKENMSEVDDDIIVELYKEYDKREKEFEERKKKSRHHKTSQESKVDNSSSPVPNL